MKVRNEEHKVVVMGNTSMDIFVDAGAMLFSRNEDGGLEVPFGSKLLARHIGVHAGGGGSNVAAALSRLGLPVSLISKLGSGHNSQQILDSLSSEGVELGLMVREEGECDYAVVLDAEGEERILLTYKQRNDNLDFSELDVTNLEANWLYLCTMVGRSLQTQVKVAEGVKETGAGIMYNPSSYLLRERPEQLDELISLADILCLNKEEGEILTGRDEVERIGDKIHDMGPKAAVITQGGEGAYCFAEGKGHHIRPHEVEVAEVTGAGDAFGAAFLAGYMRHGDIRKALEAGVTESEAVIQETGARNGLLDIEELERRIRERPHEIEGIR